MLIYGEIEPAVRIGDYWIGAKKEDILSKIDEPVTVWNRGDGVSIYTFENYKLWFNANDELQQIGVTKGFLGEYKSIRIGSTMMDVKNQFGEYNEDGDEYEITGVQGICFELADVDDWDELTAPIEWLFVYSC